MSDPEIGIWFAEDYDEDHLDVCGNIGCDEGWVADCFDGLCVNAEDGCELCLRRCDWCNQRKSDHQARNQ